VDKKQSMAGQGAVVAAAFLWSTSGLFIKLLDWHPMVIAGTRSFVAAAFLLIVRLLLPPPKDAKNRPFPLWACAIVFALTLVTYVIANKLTTAANVILLQYSAPIWAAILGWALIREKPNWEHWAALILVSCGLLLFFREGLDPGAVTGNVLAIVSGVLLGSHSVFLRMLKDGNPSDALLLGHTICGVLSIPYIILYPPSMEVPSVLSLLFMGVLQMGLASFLFSYGIKRVSAIQAMLTAIIDPIFNPVWVLLVTGEKPSVSALAGGALIIMAVVASSLIGMRREANG